MAELSAKEQLEQMIAGTHVDEIIEDGVNEEEETEVEVEEETEPEVETDEVEEAEEALEDTDQETDTAEEEETNEENDDSAEETSETVEEDLEENAQKEAEESEDESENTEPEEPNYKEFYEKVALAKFTANGKEVEGFKDPEDLVRAQQMLHGYSDKMKVFKEYKPFIKALEERGITKDSEQFNLTMSLLDGDQEAFKKILKDKGVDPLELDLENVEYAPKNTLPSEAQMLIEETYEQADNLGIGDKFNKVISKDWDVDSLQEFIKNGAVRNDLMQHLKDGTYDIVQNEINRMELLDSTGALSGKTSIEKYRLAINKLAQNAPKTEAKPEVKEEPAVDKAAEAKRIAEEAEFKRKAAERELEAAEARKKAASVSKKRVSSKPKPKPKLEELKGDDFRNAFRDMLMG